MDFDEKATDFLTIEFIRLRHDDTEIGAQVILTEHPGDEGKIIKEFIFPSWKEVKEWISE